MERKEYPCIRSFLCQCDDYKIDLTVWNDSLELCQGEMQRDISSWKYILIVF